MFLKQRIKSLILPFIGIFILSFSACKKDFDGTAKANKLPETYMTVDTIKRYGGDRFTSIINIKWWGTDVDGFVVSYKVSTPNGSFTTKRQDTTLTVNLPNGSDSFDFDVKVQSVDNSGGIDPSPASLMYPVKNSKPSISYLVYPGTSGNPSRSTPSYIFPVIKFSFQAIDPDGIGNLKSIEISLDTNSSSILLSPNTNSLILEAKDWQTSISACNIYSGSNNQLLKNNELQGLRLNDYNTLYIRAIDQVNAKSKWMSSHKFFAKKSVSNNLVVNAFQNSSPKFNSIDKFMFGNLSAISLSTFDTLKLFEVVNNSYRQLGGDNFTQSLIFKHYGSIIWYGSNGDLDVSLAQKTLQGMIGNGGKIFMSTTFTKSGDSTSAAFEFTPVQKLVAVPSSKLFAIDGNVSIKPNQIGYDSLYSTKIIPNIGALKPKGDSKIIFTVDIYDDVTTKLIIPNAPICVSSKNGTGVDNFVFFSGDLELYSGNLTNLRKFLSQAIRVDLQIK